MCISIPSTLGAVGTPGGLVLGPRTTHSGDELEPAVGSRRIDHGLGLEGVDRVICDQLRVEVVVPPPLRCTNVLEPLRGPRFPGRDVYVPAGLEPANFRRDSWPARLASGTGACLPRARRGGEPLGGGALLMALWHRLALGLRRRREVVVERHVATTQSRDDADLAPLICRMTCAAERRTK